MKRSHFWIISALIGSQPLYALAGTDGDAFQFFQEEAKVVTASRREQSIQEVPASADVITAEDIKASGVTNLWDLLRFRAGMDVMDAESVDGNRGIVSMRGFPQEFVNNLQVMVDGRSVYEPIASQVFWDQLPVQLQDIERIEIIRGPNAVLYGSGAGLGVINILTKKPGGSTGASAETEGGNRGFVQSAGAFESAVKDLSYRASYTFQRSDDFSSASPAEPMESPRSYHKGNIQTVWKPQEGSELDISAGGVWNRDMVPGFPVSGDTFDQNFQRLKFSQTVGERSTFELSSARNQYVNRTNNTQVWQYDEELLHRLTWWQERLNTVYGVRYRGAAADSSLLFGSDPDKTEDLWSGYFQQAVQVSPRLSLSGGMSWEHDSIGSGGVEPNYQVASVWTPIEDQSFRASYAVSHAIPSLFDVLARYQQNPAVLIVGDSTIRPERLTTYEIGHYAALFEKHLQINSSLYYTTVNDLNNSVVEPGASPSAVVLQFGNVNQAAARGFETEFKYRFTRANSLYVNYTYEHITDQADDTGDVTRNTPAHKVNFGGVTEWGRGFSGSVNVGYKDSYFIDSDGNDMSLAVPAYWRLDARLAYAVNPRVELFIAGQNLATTTHLEFPDGLAVPRTYQGGVTVTWGAEP